MSEIARLFWKGSNFEVTDVCADAGRKGLVT